MPILVAQFDPAARRPDHAHQQQADQAQACGMVVEAGGSLVGGVGVSGAPGGEADEACAKAGIEAVRDKLEF